MTDMSAFSRPGIPTAPEEMVIRKINQVFHLEGRTWVKDHYRGNSFALYRQILITVLIDNFGYSDAEAGAVCGRARETALHARNRVHNTLMNDKEYGERVKRVFEECK